MKSKNIILFTVLLIVGIGIISCSENKNRSEDMGKEYEKGTFGYDLNYISEKDSIILLKSEDEKAQIILSAKYQAKVFTSTANGLEGNSHGFVNYKFFDSGIVDEHMNGFGGENRLWLGPEGGRYSIFFEPGHEQIFENWHTPKAIDIEEWEVKDADNNNATFIKDIVLNNYKGTRLKLAVERTISLLNEEEIERKLKLKIPQGVNSVAYSTVNKITNQNDFKWDKETGTICIWMLDMFNPSDSAVTIIPYHKGDPKELGNIVKSDYFGEISSDRLIDQDGVLLFKTDGKSRGKLGMNALRTRGIAGNYDPITNRLTVVTFGVNPKFVYLNQEWNPETDPIVGDALNAYNDGPLEDGSIMGPFLELESSSPAAFLEPGQTLSHKHNVFHFVGDELMLSQISEILLGTSLDTLKSVF